LDDVTLMVRDAGDGNSETSRSVFPCSTALVRLYDYEARRPGAIWRLSRIRCPYGSM